MIVGAPPWEINGDEGTAMTHSPPLYAMTRSINAGPKNHVVNTIHTPVATAQRHTRVHVRRSAGLVAYTTKNAAVVHAHAFLTKIWLNTLDLRAKYECAWAGCGR